MGGAASFARLSGLLAMVLAGGACNMSWDGATSDSPGDLKVPPRRVAGSISGLLGSGLVLANTDGAKLTIEPKATSFEFAVDDGAAYGISVQSDPHTPVQRCVVTNGQGLITGNDVNNVSVACTTLGFTVSANVSGLAGSLVLSNGADTLVVQNNGVHDFAPVPAGHPFTIAVATQPAGQRCTIDHPSGVMAAADLLIPVVCLDGFLENFDHGGALPSSWTVSTTAAGGIPWHISTAGAYSAPDCMRIDETNATLDSALVSPPIAIVRADAQLWFEHAYESESTYDGGVLEIQIDGGKFTDILEADGAFLMAGYTGTIQGGISPPPLAGRNAWTGSSGGYVKTMVALPAAAAGKSIVLRWRWGNDNNGSVPNGGWRVDDIAVYR